MGLLERKESIAVSRGRYRRAITLFEILAMVAIVAVLAATVVPQFLPSTNDPKSSSLQFNLHMVRSQIGRYKLSIPARFPRWPTLPIR